MQGDTLLSNLCRPLLYFLEETPEQKGIHDTTVPAIELSTNPPALDLVTDAMKS
jgi:hypothetical protein